MLYNEKQSMKNLYGNLNELKAIKTENYQNFLLIFKNFTKKLMMVRDTILQNSKRFFIFLLAEKRD